MNHESFMKWALNQLVPNLNPHSAITLSENASCRNIRMNQVSTQILKKPVW